jgi:hypothetical protein
MAERTVGTGAHPQETIMFCQKCGALVGDESQFCAKCGAPVVQATTETAATAAPPRRGVGAKVVGWLCVVVGLLAVFAPIPARIMPPEVPVVLAFPILWIGFAIVFPGSCRIMRAGSGFVGAIAVVGLVLYVRSTGMLGQSDRLWLSGDVSVATADQVALSDLLAEYKTNEVAADQRYKGKVIETTGVLTSVKNDLAGRPFVIVSDNDLDQLHGVQCSLAESAVAQAATLKPGERVTVKGRVNGLMMFVQVGNCTVQAQSAAATAAPATQPIATQQTAAPASAAATESPAAASVSAEATAPFAGKWSGLTRAIQGTVGSIEVALDANPQIRFESGDTLRVSIVGLENGVLILKPTAPQAIRALGEEGAPKGRSVYWIALERVTTVEGFGPGEYLTVAEFYGPDRPTVGAALEKMCGDEKRNCGTYAMTK